MSEKSKRYLYGASVQGIQDYIFQTNELKDIVGASDLVEAICTDLFEKMVGDAYDKDASVVQAAGNIKYVFDDEALCRRVVREFPKKVVGLAPGVIISQAVVALGDDFADAIDRLEARLREQRNIPMRRPQLGLMGMRRSRKTGLPAVEVKNGDYIDRATQCKQKDSQKVLRLCRKAFGYKADELTHRHVAYNINDITDRNNWIAIIHADGNGLGQVVQRIGKNRKEFAQFSCQLNEVTIAAAVDAYRQTVEGRGTQGCISMRPVVLGGDDLTVIIRGDLALPFTEAFLQAFEAYSREQLDRFVGNKRGLTACAGIAYIKASYPSYYGYDLAETLCSQAKKHAKALSENRAPSCVMIHKVQDSFVGDYDELVRRELTPCEGHSFEFGPYFLSVPGAAPYWSIRELCDAEGKLGGEDGNALKSNLRRWLTAMHSVGGDKRANQLKDRILDQVAPRLKLLASKLLTGVEVKDCRKYTVYDLLALCSIDNMVTRK